MERVKEICKKLFCIHWLLALVLSVVLGAALIGVFLYGLETAWFVYPLYAASFYVLTADCVVLVPKCIALAKRKQEKEKAQTPEKREKSLKINLWQHLLVNLVYGTGQVIQGCVVGSAWVGGNGLYNLGHGFAHLVLVRCEKKLDRMENDTKKELTAWKYYMVSGVALFGVNLTMTGLAFQMIWMGRGKFYSEIMVIAVAAYTFYRLTIAVINVVKCRKNNSPILGASRNFAMTGALMNLFSLQVALLDAFGGGYEYTFLMNSLTGFAVCLSTLLGGLGMVVHGRKRMKEIRGEYDGK